ncbi:hypothetical protein [Cellulomonas sp. ATA003]|uniref:hypothetical protein n=1 Tax=Cellulomonas sp. ATA003 TaxID=3073064 RepID=UPI0028735651|nr:hypothetical protein [Cellulomonas sp. ATA003]WNB86147.1 hypothetical protein REH70_02390 [Cellulomonas sp. ATA003]
MTEFSIRTTQIDEVMTGVLGKFYAAHGRGPNRIEVSRLRQQVTRATRPDKHVTPLADLMTVWRARATRRTGKTPTELTAAVLRLSHTVAQRADQIPSPVIDRLAEHTIGQVMTRRSTWTRWNVMAEAARSTRAIRVATPAARLALLERVTDAALGSCLSLQAPDPLTVPVTYTRPDGASQFTRAGRTVTPTTGSWMPKPSSSTPRPSTQRRPPRQPGSRRLSPPDRCIALTGAGLRSRRTKPMPSSTSPCPRHG